MMGSTIRAGLRIKFSVLFLFFILACCANYSFANEKVIYKRTGGYYFTQGTDTVQATLLIPVDETGSVIIHLLQKEVSIESPSKNQRTYFPQNIVEFGFTYAEKKYLMKSVHLDVWLGINNMFTKQIFLYVAESFGKVFMYQYFNKGTSSQVENSPAVNAADATLLLQGNDQKLITIKEVGLKKKLLKHFSDCSQLRSRIEQGYYQAYSMNFFIKDYSQLCH
jgi:hypothetical protein